MDARETLAFVKKIRAQAEAEGVEFHVVWNRWAIRKARQLKLADDDLRWQTKGEERQKEFQQALRIRARLGFKSCKIFNEIPESYIDDPTAIGWGGDFSFQECLFPFIVWFYDIEFHVPVDFFKSEFFYPIYIYSSKLFRQVNFEFVQFKNGALFEDVRFEEIAYFDDMVAHSSFSADRCNFLMPAYFEGGEVIGMVSFAHTTFEDLVSFAYRSFKGNLPSSTDFSKVHFNRVSLFECEFESVPDFSLFQITHLPDISSIKVPNASLALKHLKPNHLEPVKRVKPSEILPVYRREDVTPVTVRAVLAARYRALRAMASQAKDFEKELEFLAYQLQVEGKPWSKIYHMFSNYGRSAMLPIAWFFGVMFAMAGIFAGCVCGTKESFYLSFLNSLPVIGLRATEARTKVIDDVFGESPTSLPYIWDVLFHVQNLVAAGLIFFIFLALRNMFKMK